MDRHEFIQHLREGKPATEGVKELSGHWPGMVTLAVMDDGGVYMRYCIMMAGDTMAALTILALYPNSTPDSVMERIRAGEPLGAVLPQLTRKGTVEEYTNAVKASATLRYGSIIIGYVEEIFTSSLLEGK